MAVSRKACLLLILVCFIAGFSEGFAAPAYALPDHGYNYSYWNEAEPAPYPYAAEKHIYGADLGIGHFKEPQDVFVGEDRRIYIADTGNNRIVCLDERGNLIRVIDGFRQGDGMDTFNKPYGVYVDANGIIYVADTYNNRIVKLTGEGEWLAEYDKPESSIIPKDFQFFPLKLNVDKANRIYVVAQGAYEGIMELDASGGFKGYVGTNKVRFSPADLLWKRLSTKEQAEKMELFLPIEFSNLDVDDRGFIYAVSSEVNTNEPIKRFNPSGEDILRREGYFPPMGDVSVIRVDAAAAGDAAVQLLNEGSSRFIDVISEESGMYSGLDSTRNRIFTYDRDGNLLYQFGGIGTRSNNFQKPVAIEMIGDRMAVIDNEMNRLTIFAPTRYGTLIRDAVKAHYNGMSEEAAEAWNGVLQLNANFDIAYIGMGKALLKQDRNKLAMDYFKNGNNRKYYSEAFKRYRKELVWDNFGTIMTVLLSGAAVAIAARIYWVRRRPNVYFVDTGVVKAPFHTMFRPFAGFWELKYEGKGRVGIALLILFMLVGTMIMKRQFAGFIVNFNKPNELNSVDELAFIVLPFLLFCVANWSLTTLMDGEGKFREIVMAAGYALLPLVVLYVPQILFSTMITREEAPFYYLIESVAYIWFLWLLFIGMMTVHQYSILKTVVTMFLTVVVMIFIVFLGILCFSLLQQMAAFVISLFTEIRARA
ncbi:YIP1 family protein [Paenibacillus sp. LHD-117]|uniref:YIP1 family protein n=1 Tax=Paenibacillus sp. LHD-117 TaxID=3071412 RepID=UPI0027DF3008|nr:YIP1 family protein [Paenibacillus sp. LHD-117]MDQ6421867.1 YIP1 family protein [Paenibacillus sp. LHD-117]